MNEFFCDLRLLIQSVVGMEETCEIFDLEKAQQLVRQAAAKLREAGG